MRNRLDDSSVAQHLDGNRHLTGRLRAPVIVKLAECAAIASDASAQGIPPKPTLSHLEPDSVATGLRSDSAPAYGTGVHRVISIPSHMPRKEFMTPPILSTSRS
jgi:hypothetical protein